MRVLLLSKYDRLGASSRLRSYQYLPYFNQHGVDVEVRPLFDDAYVRSLYKRKVSKWRVVLAYMQRLRHLFNARSYDLIWVEKEALPWFPAFLELFFIRRMAPLVVDYDDAVFHRYDTHRSALVRSVLGRKIDWIMAASDVVIAGSEYLVERAQLAGARRIEKLPTVVDLSRYSSLPIWRVENVLTIGWIGSPGTAHYLLPLIPAFRLLHKNFNVRVLAIGSNNRAEFDDLVEVLPWSEDTEAFLLAHIDIGIMPLRDEPFERGKCAYKLIQYMASGKPVVASPVGENVHVVRPGVNGFLASSQSEWLSALSNLCNDTTLRERCGQAGRAIVEETYSLTVTAPRFLGLIRSLAR
jgi:glycosyltransferase involved in cell wall biosynthesis